MRLSQLDNHLTRTQLHMHQAIIEQVKERNANNTTNVTDKFFNPATFPNRLYMGTFSWSAPTTKTRWILKSANLDPVTPMTPTDLSRHYLMTKYADRKIKCTTEQWQKMVDPANKRRAPQYCKPVTLENAVHIDITSAFWQITRAVGWDVEYNPGKYLIQRSSMDDYPYARLKLARNCLVSLGMPSPMRVWTGSALIWQKRSSILVNLILWALVMDVLHGIASQIMDELECYYVNTDGFIVDSRHVDACFDIINDWGLEARIKGRGECDIVHIGCYAFNNPVDGFCPTLNYKRMMYRKRGREINKVYRPDIAWLRPRFQSLAIDASLAMGELK